MYSSLFTNLSYMPIPDYSQFGYNIFMNLPQYRPMPIFNYFENNLPQIWYNSGYSVFNTVPESEIEVDFCKTKKENIFAKNTYKPTFYKKTPVMKDYAKEFSEKADSISLSKYGSNADMIKNLAPDMQVKTKLLLDYAKSKGLNVTITSGFRTQAKQQELLRTRPGYAAKNSLHCQGKAIDINISSGKDSDYKLLADYAKSIGMRWGGDFSKVKERWHFDMGWA